MTLAARQIGEPAHVVCVLNAQGDRAGYDAGLEGMTTYRAPAMAVAPATLQPNFRVPHPGDVFVKCLVPQTLVPDVWSLGLATATGAPTSYVMLDVLPSLAVTLAYHKLFSIAWWTRYENQLRLMSFGGLGLLRIAADLYVESDSESRNTRKCSTVFSRDLTDSKFKPICTAPHAKV